MQKNLFSQKPVLWGALFLAIGAALGLILLMIVNQPQPGMPLWLKVFLSLAVAVSITACYSGALLILRCSFKRRPPTPLQPSGLPEYDDRLKFVEQMDYEQQDIERYRLYQIVTASL